jgi:hypothetical protein
VEKGRREGKPDKTASDRATLMLDWSQVTRSGLMLTVGGMAACCCLAVMVAGIHTRPTVSQNAAVRALEAGATFECQNMVAFLAAHRALMDAAAAELEQLQATIRNVPSMVGCPLHACLVLQSPCHSYLQAGKVRVMPLGAPDPTASELTPSSFIHQSAAHKCDICNGDLTVQVGGMGM